MSTVPSAEQVQRGPAGTVWAVRTEEGRCPALEFLAGLELRARAQFKARFERMCAVGSLRTPEMGHFLDAPGKPKIFEIKAEHGPGFRLYAVRVGANWYLTHGCKKPKDSRVPREAHEARRIFAVGGGSD